MVILSASRLHHSRAAGQWDLARSWVVAEVGSDSNGVRQLEWTICILRIDKSLDRKRSEERPELEGMTRSNDPRRLVLFQCYSLSNAIE